MISHNISRFQPTGTSHRAPADNADDVSDARFVNRAESTVGNVTDQPSLISSHNCNCATHGSHGVDVLSDEYTQSAKAAVLGSIRKALVANPIEAPEPSRGYISSSDNAPGSDPVIEVFKNALIDYKAQVQVVDSTRKIPGAIAKALEDSSSIVVPEGLDKQWLQKLQKKQIHIDSLDKPLSHHALDQINAVVTSSRCAVSHTGTIMLDGTPDQGRRAISLVPDTHVCVVFASTVYPTVPQAVKVLSRHPLRACTWIAGPSATSDIELIRVDGVHGPRNLHVIIVRD